MAARFPQVSTHKISLGLLARCLEANGRTRAWLLGVQPESLQPGAGLTPAVQNTLKILTELLGKMAAANPAVAHSALSERRTLLGAPIEAPRSAIACLSEKAVVAAILLCFAGAVLTLGIARLKTLAGWLAFAVTAATAGLIFAAVGRVLVAGPSPEPATFWPCRPSGSLSGFTWTD